MAEIKTQAALDKALKKAKAYDTLTLAGQTRFELRVPGAIVLSVIAMAGVRLDVAAYEGGRAVVEAWENSTVTARENSTVTARGNSTVTAWENSTVTARGNSTVTARGNSTVTARENSTVTAWENSTVTARGNSTVTAWENSTVTARENSTVTARENSTVTAWGYAFVRLHSAKRVDAAPTCIIAQHGDVAATGGHAVLCPAPQDPASWCSFYGLEVHDGVTTLFKAVDGNFRSPHGWDYTPGKEQKPCPDWDGGARECGYGLHFSPHPEMAREFFHEATRYLACQVRLEDMAVHPKGQSPQKCKARMICAPTVEVDRNGVPVPTSEAEAA